jgi:hypothetical protein
VSLTPMRMLKTSGRSAMVSSCQRRLRSWIVLPLMPRFPKTRRSSG